MWAPQAQDPGSKEGGQSPPFQTPSKKIPEIPAGAMMIKINAPTSLK